ncbi:MAG: alpha/beta hydrolase fold domain-containing protein [Planctomycetes bacterium]|nr:alpha/beta hydrolase fold domain-containing protein [Planctomycetota bacterium]
MNKTNLLTYVLILSTALTVSAQQRSRGQARQNTQKPRVPEGVRAQRNIAYVVNGHERHVLDIFVPDKADGPLPLIIWIHGGGWQNGSKERCLPLRKDYTQRGYAVASINYRLSGHATFPAQIEDCKAAIRWLRAHAKEYNIDPHRFGVWGSSAGGHLVSLVGTSGEVKEFDVGGNLEQSSRVQAVCDYYGPTDFKVFVTTPGYEKHANANSPESKLIGGAVLENKGKASRLNPITYVTRDDPPFLIVHGDEDRTVPINQSRLLFESLKGVDVSVHFHTIHGAGHGRPGFDAPEIEKMVLAFFERHLKSKSPHPGSPHASTSNSTATEEPARNTQVADRKISVNWVDLYEPHADDEMPYRLMKPMHFDSNKRYPVIVSLHGGGGRGTDNRKQLRGWNKLLAEEQRRSDYPCYVLAPQANRLWDAAHLKSIKAVVAALPSVDMDRIYIMGHSMGGHGTYILIQIDPGYFAAAAPSAGTGLPQTEEFIDASLIKDVPIWSFHGDNDKVCPFERDQKLFAEMKKSRGNMKLTTWAGDGHGVAEKMITGSDNGSTQLSSDRCDPEPALLEWLFKQKLSDRRQIGRSRSQQQRINNWLSSQDPNGDGRIALDESTGLMKKNFRQNDSNKDGFLDKMELGKLADLLAKTASRLRNRNANRSRRPTPTDAQVMARVPDGVTMELNITYREGNDAWKLDLAKPDQPSDTPRPAIVFIHGGGWTRGDKRAEAFLGQTLEYAAKGYVCVTVNYRLDPAKLPAVEDVKCAVRWLRAHAEKYNVDPDRIGAYGNSAGAHLATMLGISHTERRLERDGPWQEFSSKVQAVAASATPTVPNLRGEADFGVKLIQPMSYITANAPPFLLFHEESDSTVNVSNSDNFVEAMKEAGAKDITYHRYTDGTGHGVFQRNIDKTGPLMEAFFKRTLGK